MLRSLLLLVLFPVAAGAAEKPEAAAPFDPASAAPYFSDRPDGLAAQADARFHVEDWAGAQKLFDAYGKKEPHARDHAQAAFLGALSLLRAGRALEAAARFDALAASYPLLGDYHHLYAARGYLQGGKPELAEGRARKVPAGSPLDGEARIIRASAQRLLQRSADAEKEYRGYLEAYPKSWREPEVRYRLAEAILAAPEKTAASGKGAAGKPGKTTKSAKAGATDPAGKNPRWPEARALLREVMIRFPTEVWAKQAQALLGTVEPEALALGGPERLLRGLSLFESMRNPESEAELREAQKAGGLSPVESCVAAFHVAQSVFKQRDRPRAAALFDEAAAVCERAPKDDPSVAELHAKSLYQGGRCHAARGEAQAALALFARVEAEHPTHSYADDARLRQAEVWEAQLEHARDARNPSAVIAASSTNSGKTVPGADLLDGGTPEDYAAHVSALLSDMADRYPTGDQGGEALFRLAFHAFRDGNLADARRWLELELKKYPREQGYAEAGRTLYWLGRIAEREGKERESKEHYYQAANDYPLSYYSLQAINRIIEHGSPDASVEVALLRLGVIPNLRIDPPPPAPIRTSSGLVFRRVDEPTFHFAPRPLFAEPGFRRGVELARLGLGAEAKRELSAAGIKVPEQRNAKVEGKDQEELLWVASVLYDRAGEYALSHFIPRYLLTEYARHWPVGDWKKYWQLSFPLAYRELIVDNTAKTGQPSSLEFAIVREESAFDPLTESFANAVGLTQLTPPPAKRFAEGLPFTREALKHPAINVAIGARELGDLWKRSGGQAALTIAGYNAGEGAVRRWLQKSPPVTTLDELIESIPYDETRGYTKRVLGSYFAYHFLYDTGDPVPSLPPDIHR